MDDLPPDRWHQIDRIFAEALDRPDDERMTFVQRACVGDADLYREVLALLDSRHEARAVLGESAAGFAGPLLPGLHDHLADTTRLAAGARIGPYRILDEVGRGGMGAVYLAERDDDQYRRCVALKLVKRGMDTDEILRRFRHERQILAALEHPLIARLYDGGVSDDGRPYLAMEYIDGAPIDAYCDAKTLNVDERLRLFEAVCEAVHYAHQNLVVHRDLKPSNILVTDEGTVKLLDFGIAKLLDQEPDTSAPVTRTGVRVMTPEYASPEQAHGETVTTASDVYALGVVLYELLTGRRPHTDPQPSRSNAEGSASAPEPTRPSTAVTKAETRRRRDGTMETVTPQDVSASRATTVERLQRRLRGDLDTILLMALRQEPERRYASAQAFVEDIKRHLAGLPVAARPDTQGYRLRKFVRRHRFGTATAAAFVLLLAGGALALALQQAATARERDRARLEAEKLTEVRTFLTSLFKAADPDETQGRTTTVLDLLTRGTEQIQDELKDRPEIRAEILATLGDVYSEMGDYEKARTFLEEALALRRSLPTSDPLSIAKSLNDLATLHFYLSDYETAKPLVEEALALQTHRLGRDHLDVVYTLNNLATLSANLGDYENAEALHKQVLAARTKQLGRHHPDVAMSLNNLGVLLYRMNHLAEAERYFRETLAVRRTLLGEEHPDVAMALNNLAAAIQDQGRPDEAEPLYREALTLRRKVLGADHPRVAVTAYLLAILLHDQGRYDEAEPLYREALTIDRKRLGNEHSDVGADLHKLGTLLHDKGDYTAAERAFREALAIFRTVSPDHRGRLATVNTDLGACLTSLARYPEAEALLLNSYEVFQEERGTDHAQTRKALHHLIALYDAWGKPEKSTMYRAMLPEDDA